MTDKQKVKNVDNAYRDTHSKAIIFNGAEKHLQRRKQQLKVINDRKRIDVLEKNVDDIKRMLNILINKE
jgi:hypothetical protein